MQTTALYMAEPIADFIAVTFTAVLFFFQFKKSLAALDKKRGIIAWCNGIT